MQPLHSIIFQQKPTKEYIVAKKNKKKYIYIYILSLYFVWISLIHACKHQPRGDRFQRWMRTDCSVKSSPHLHHRFTIAAESFLSPVNRYFPFVYHSYANRVWHLCIGLYEHFCVRVSKCLKSMKTG